MVTAASAANASAKCNIILIGDGAVGKTSLLNMYSEGIFSTSHMATLGLDYVNKSYIPEGGTADQKMQVKIWDTAGQERFRTLTQSFYKQAQGVILCFDVTNANSFKNVKMWLESIYADADENIAKILVGNKVDRAADRKISKHDAQEMADKNEMKYFEASAKENQGVTELMNEIMEQVYTNRASSFTTQRLPTFKLRQSDVNRETTLRGNSTGKCKC